MIRIVFGDGRERSLLMILSGERWYVQLPPIVLRRAGWRGYSWSRA